MSSTGTVAARLRARATPDPARMPALQRILRASAERLSAELAALLGVEASAAIGQVAAVADDRALRDGGDGLRVTWGPSGSPDGAQLAISRTALDTVLDIFFGGDGSEALAGVSRAPTALDRSVSRRLFTALTATLTAGFGDALPPNLSLGSEEAGTAGETRSGAWLLLTFEIAVATQTVTFPVLLPRLWLAALTKAPSEPTASPVATDPVWAALLREEITQTALPVQAIIGEPGMTLADVMRLRVGTVLPLRATARSPVDLVCSGTPMMTGELGQRDGAYTVRVGAPARA